MDRARVSWFAAAAVALVVAAGCGFGGRDGDRAAPVADAQSASAAPVEDPLILPSPQEPEETTPARKPKKTPAQPKGAKSTAPVDPNWDQAPACYTVAGPKISRSKVKSALQAAAKRQYWRTEAPSLRVTWPLVKAVAWQESGWQSNVRNCDGGVGVMQVMPDTLDHMNLRFGLSYDADQYQDNAFAGANYLAWLTKRFGDEHFTKTYDLSPGRCKSHHDRCLLNLVIAAYNAGDGTVDAAYAKKQLANADYVDSVRSLMESCYCDRF